MTKNMGSADRIVRLLLVAIIGLLYFTGVISNVLAIVLGIIAVIFFLTSLVGFCPLYFPFGIKTRKAKE